MNARPNIVLIHGAWAEGSCWSGVIERLQADGYHVTAPQFPLTALADDVARLRQVLNLQDGPAVVAGHSYGGQIMTALGADAPNVAGRSTSPRSGLTRVNRWAGCCRKDR
jgi:pimeloyl-ACP methyl ester carboxylesterase